MRTSAAFIDTIYALATPYGRSGVAVVRVSGPGAADSLTLLTGDDHHLPRRAVLRVLRDPVTEAVIDQALVLFFSGPASYTGEDVVEYHLHGGVAVIDGLLAALARAPSHRMALPGEFTRRAFENGKMDLTAAEAVADLIDAETEAQKQQALSQMEGNLARLYEDWRARLAKALAYAEALIDFSDEDLPDDVAAQVLPVITILQDEINAHLNDNRRGERLRNGIRVAVIGAPNAGKSSLVNALAQRDVAIVSPLAGTTRDVIEAHLNIGGYPVILADTAGLRPEQLNETGHDAIESEGVKRALKQAQSADIKLLLFDGTIVPDAATLALQDPTSILVYNKMDDEAQKPAAGQIYLSTKTGRGQAEFTRALTDKIKSILGTRSGPSLTRARHREALEQCADALARAQNAPAAELIAEDIRLAIRHLGHITGRVDVEDLLDIIFRDFCIGK